MHVGSELILPSAELLTHSLDLRLRVPPTANPSSCRRIKLQSDQMRYEWQVWACLGRKPMSFDAIHTYVPCSGHHEHFLCAFLSLLKFSVLYVQ